MEKRYRATRDQWRVLKPAVRQLRRQTTAAEDVLWQALRDGRLAGTKFRRQHAIGRTIVDFFAPSPRLVVEVDGPIHQGQAGYDASRDEYLNAQGVRILRVTNDDVTGRLPWVLAEIASLCTTRQAKQE